MNPDNLRPLNQCYTPRQLRKRASKIADRREFSGERHLHKRERIQKLHMGWTPRMVFALDHFNQLGTVFMGALARGLTGMRPSDRRPGKYTPAPLGKSRARLLKNPGESA